MSVSGWMNSVLDLIFGPRKVEVLASAAGTSTPTSDRGFLSECWSEYYGGVGLQEDDELLPHPNRPLPSVSSRRSHQRYSPHGKHRPSRSKGSSGGGSTRLGKLYLGDVCEIESVGNRSGSQVVTSKDLFCRILEFLPIQAVMACRRLNRDAEIHLTTAFQLVTLPLDEIWYPGWDRYSFFGGSVLEAVLNHSKLKQITASLSFCVPLEVFGNLLRKAASTLEEVDVKVEISRSNRLPLLPVDYLTCLENVIFPRLKKLCFQVAQNGHCLPLPFLKRHQCPSLETLEVGTKAFEMLCHWDDQWEATSLEYNHH
eukprot:Protomagalhaensia_sp_Gyna_25__336@NODE_1159_length_2123_cov_13_268714_g919_i0_p1_GENE_NODE_1159_length_2123_cov_13_268714_g919_i0NODE_1159_length_2123_cov_13_268714_g919_i0_p1_ORF_typecomplete_len313_score46_44_NODE_1159_length_2123_cov_13_268714_g919_i03241262